MATKRKTADKVRQNADETPKTSSADTQEPPAAQESPPPSGPSDQGSRRGGAAIIVTCPMSAEQATLQHELVERYEKLPSHTIDPRVDNALAITSDGRKLALDARMLSPEAQDHPGSKINTLVENVSAIWRRTGPRSGTQMIFADLGVRPTPWGFSAYDEIIAKLTARGIPRSQIAAIGNSDSDAQQQELFDRVRSGQVRVLLGSTARMALFNNVPKRLVALHHLDCPWSAPAIEDREGRILRQGHDNEPIAIYRYITEKSLDALMWQALLSKARFLEQVRTALSSGSALAAFDGAAPEGDRETPVVELAEQVKALQAAPTTEAAPPSEQRRSSAEEPGTMVDGAEVEQARKAIGLG